MLRRTITVRCAFKTFSTRHWAAAPGATSEEKRAALRTTWRSLPAAQKDLFAAADTDVTVTLPTIEFETSPKSDEIGRLQEKAMKARTTGPKPRSAFGLFFRDQLPTVSGTDAQVRAQVRDRFRALSAAELEALILRFGKLPTADLQQDSAVIALRTTARAKPADGTPSPYQMFFRRELRMGVEGETFEERAQVVNKRFFALSAPQLEELIKLHTTPAKKKDDDKATVASGFKKATSGISAYALFLRENLRATPGATFQDKEAILRPRFRNLSPDEMSDLKERARVAPTREEMKARSAAQRTSQRGSAQRPVQVQTGFSLFLTEHWADMDEDVGERSRVLMERFQSLSPQERSEYNARAANDDDDAEFDDGANAPGQLLPDGL